MKSTITSLSSSPAAVWTRRKWLASSLAAVPSVLGKVEAKAEPLNEAMRNLLRRHGFPGGALGIARAGEVAFMKGFGLANLERREPVTERSRFRIASVTKPITSAAILRLAEKGKLALDDFVLTHLPVAGSAKAGMDSRWSKVTLRNLLQHSGGWDKRKSGDALFRSPEICRSLRILSPASANDTIRWMLGRPMDFDPGSRYAYCNFGYCLLGRVIESVTGQSYEDAVGELVLRQVGAVGMRLGKTLQSQPDEVGYHAQEGGQGTSVFPNTPATVPWPYGAFSLEANDANGGWIASVGEILRFLTALDEAATAPLLQPHSLRAIASPSAVSGLGSGVHYGLGWMVRPKGQGGRPNLWHIGALPGTLAIAVRLGDGFDWCALFNSRPAAWEKASLDVQNSIHAAARKVWP